MTVFACFTYLLRTSRAKSETWEGDAAQKKVHMEHVERFATG